MTAAADPGEEAPKEGEPEGKPMSFFEHLEELRKRILWAIIAFIAACFGAWEIREPMLAWLVQPFNDSWKSKGISGAATLHFGAPAAAFVAYVKLAMIGGAAIAAPVVFYQLWSFIAPGLYKKEKRYVIPFVLLSSILFIGGGYFGWRAAFPIAFDYFLSMSGTVGEQGVSIQPTIMMGDYLDFVTQMLLGFGLVFEIPLFILFLALAGVVNYLQLIKFGRWYILLAFIAAAIFTPPDVTSQMVMAVPMILLYFVSIGLAFVFGKSPSEEQKKAFWGDKKKPKKKKA